MTEIAKVMSPRPPSASIPYSLIEACLPPALLVTMVWLYKLADWKTGVVRYVSAAGLASLSNGQYSKETYKDALQDLERMGYITRHFVKGSHDSYSVTVHNYAAVDKDRDWEFLGVINPHDLMVFSDLPKRPRKSRARQGFGGSGVKLPPEATPEVTPEATLKSLYSTMSTLSRKERAEEQEVQERADALVPLPHSQSQIAGSAEAQAEPRMLPEAARLARHWWAFQGRRPGQVSCLPVWTAKLSRLLSAYPDLDRAMAFWFQDEHWGDGREGSTAAKHLLRFEGKGDSLDWFISKLLARDDHKGTLRYKFERWKKICEKNGKTLADLGPAPEVPVAAPPVPAPPPVQKEPVREHAGPGTPDIKDRFSVFAVKRPEDDPNYIPDIEDLPEDWSRPATGSRRKSDADRL